MLKIGMYVRCSIDVENPNEPRDFISGWIVEINDFSEVAKVEFFDLLNLRKYYNVPQTLEFPLSKLNHCILRNGSLAEYSEICIILSSTILIRVITLSTIIWLLTLAQYWRFVKKILKPHLIQVMCHHCHS